MSPSNTGTGPVEPAVRAELHRLRDSIDNIDAPVVHMLASRLNCTQQVGPLKAVHPLPRQGGPGTPTRTGTPAPGANKAETDKIRMPKRLCALPNPSGSMAPCPY